MGLISTQSKYALSVFRFVTWPSPPASISAPHAPACGGARPFNSFPRGGLIGDPVGNAVRSRAATHLLMAERGTARCTAMPSPSSDGGVDEWGVRDHAP